MQVYTVWFRSPATRNPNFEVASKDQTWKVKILTAGSRIIAFDQQESAFFVKYKVKENQLNIFADDTYPR